MVRRTGARKLALIVAAVVGVSTLNLSTSTADVTAVEGEAYGVFASVSLFGGPANVAGPIAPVTLPAGGSAVPITATAPNGNVVFGPATIFSSGPVSTSTQGTTGPGGSVTSSATLAPVNTSDSEIFTATSISSTCTASETGVTGSTTVANGTIILQDPNPDTSGEEGEDIRNIPTLPEPNTTYEGTVANVNDNFRAVFNEQIVNPDGSLTVNAYHLYLLGPTAVGEVIVGHVVCGVTATPTSTSTSSPPTSSTSSSTSSTSSSTSSTSSTTSTMPTTTSSTTTSTMPTTTSSTTTSTMPTTTSTTTTLPATTTTLPATTTTLPATTTTLPATTTTLPATTTTLPATTTTLPTTTTTLPTTTTTPPASGTCAQLQQQKAAFNAQITAIEASLAQSLSGAQLAAAIAQLEATRASGNAQFDQAIAAFCGVPTTPTTSVPATTTTAPPVDNAEICAALLEQASNPFVAPFIQQLLIQYRCV